MKVEFRFLLASAFLGMSSPTIAVDFNVSSSTELQSALTTAASNGGDDVITLAPGVYAGNFKYLAGEAYSVTVQGDPSANREEIILDGERRAFVLRVDPRDYAMSLTIQHLTVANGKSDEPGGGLTLLGPIDLCSTAGDGVDINENPNAVTEAVEQCYKEKKIPDLLLSDLVIRDNFACHGAGVFVGGSRTLDGTTVSAGFSRATIENSLFLGNGAYFPPGSGDNGGSISSTCPYETAGHLAVAVTESILLQGNRFNNLALPLNTADGPSLTSFTSAISLSAENTSTYTTSTTSDDSKLIVKDNVFEALGEVKVETANAEDTYIETEVVQTVRELYKLNGTTTFENNEIRGFSGSSFGALSGRIAENLFTANATRQATALAGVIEDNIFELGEGSSSMNFGTGNGVDFVLSGTVRRNIFRELLGSIRVVGSVSLGGFPGDPGYGEPQTTIFTENLISGIGKSARPQEENQGTGDPNVYDPGAVPGGGSETNFGDDYCTVFFQSGAFSILNNTVARTVGSGLCVDSNSFTIANNIVWAAPGVEGGYDIQQIGYADASVLVNNIFQTATEFWDINDGNINLDPQYFDVGAGDLHVRTGSPAINAGADNRLSAEQVYDLDGNARVLNGAVDIGAYERSTTALHPADTNGDNEISKDEFDAYNAAWRSNAVWESAPSIIPIDFVSRAGYLLQSGGKYENIGVGKPATWVPVSSN